MDGRQTIVVGVDGSGSARQALRYALADGRRRGALVRVVAVLRPPSRWEVRYAASDPVSLLFAPSSQDELRADLEKRACRMVDDVRAEDPVFADVPVTVDVVEGHPAQVLVEQSRAANLLVVGHQGHTAAGGLGSVALACVLHATVPVTVVRPGNPRPRQGSSTFTDVVHLSLIHI